MYNKQLTRWPVAESPVSADSMPSQSSLYNSPAVCDSRVISGHRRSVVTSFSIRTFNQYNNMFQRMINFYSTDRKKFPMWRSVKVNEQQPGNVSSNFTSNSNFTSQAIST